MMHSSGMNIRTTQAPPRVTRMKIFCNKERIYTYNDTMQATRPLTYQLYFVKYYLRSEKKATMGCVSREVVYVWLSF